MRSTFWLSAVGDAPLPDPIPTGINTPAFRAQFETPPPIDQQFTPDAPAPPVAAPQTFGMTLSRLLQPPIPLIIGGALLYWFFLRQRK